MLRRRLLSQNIVRVALVKNLWRLPVLLAVLFPLVVFVASDPVYSTTSFHRRVPVTTTTTVPKTTTTTTVTTTTSLNAAYLRGSAPGTGSHAPRPAPAPAPTTTTTTAPAPAPSATSSAALFGMSVPSLLGESPSQMSATLTTMASIGLRWVRVDADWDYIQPTSPSTYDWSATDAVVAAAKSAGISVDLVIDDSPAWANGSNSGGTFTQPTSAAAYAAFAGQVAAHYGPLGVHAYEIWNEPNIQGFWLPAPNPTFYTSMLKDAYAAIKAVQPGSTVLSGGLAPAATDGTDYNAIDFLNDMYANGAAGSFDALGYHAYSYPALADTYESWSGWSQMNATSPSIRSVMTAHGDGNKQIWITEVGAPSAGPDGVGTTAQAQEVTQVVQAVKSSPWIGECFFYTYQDSATDPDYFGLLNADGSQKPAWGALAAAVG